MSSLFFFSFVAEVSLTNAHFTCIRTFQIRNVWIPTCHFYFTKVFNFLTEWNLFVFETVKANLVKPMFVGRIFYTTSLQMINRPYNPPDPPLVCHILRQQDFHLYQLHSHSILAHFLFLNNKNFFCFFFNAEF